jgi:hypothetical protein
VHCSNNWTLGLLSWFAIFGLFAKPRVEPMACRVKLHHGAFTKDRERGASGPRRRRLAIWHGERVFAPRRGCDTREIVSNYVREIYWVAGEPVGATSHKISQSWTYPERFPDREKANKT